MQNYKLDNYVRMFGGKSTAFLYADIFFGYYSNLEVIIVQGQEIWMTFIPKMIETVTLEEGSKLYTDKFLYEAYFNEFQKYIKQSSQYFKGILDKSKIDSEDLSEFFKNLSNFFYYYSKQEFFYTDSIIEAQMVISIAEFNKLKLESRSYLNQILFQEEGFLKSFIKKISKQENVDEIDLLYYSIDELKKLTDKGIRVEKRDLVDRGTLFFSKDQILFGKKAENLANEFLLPYLQNSLVYSGTVANTGKVSGKARVLITDFIDFKKINIDVDEMEFGEILVVETTSPELIKACKKAAAIITNQGGMLSHAAIISRELGIPCIVGMNKDIVKNIKTGDFLEVDADNGIVKIIK